MDPRNDLTAVFFKALEKVDPFLMIRDHVATNGSRLTITGPGGPMTLDLASYGKVLVTGIGKAAPRMAAGIEEVLGGFISDGAVITKYGQGIKLGRIRVLEAGHPIPDENSVRGARALYDMATAADEKTLVVNLISGGGSALFSLPREGVTLEDLQETTRALLESGADIREVNCIRKHLSKVKGGGFARAAYPARMVNLILSDVVGDRLDTIASGITAPDATTFGMALGIVERYGLRARLPRAVMETIESGAQGKIPETPKEGDPVFGSVTNLILGSNTEACRAARDHGGKLGYHAFLLTSSLTGEAREIAKLFTAMVRDLKRGASDLVAPVLIVAGGETTVTVRGRGAGGRNQELALSFLADLLETTDSLAGVHFLSAGTDGIDGPTDAAGALIGPEMQEIVKVSGISPEEYLSRNDSHRFFEQTGGLFRTGPTGTNVCDLQLLIFTGENLRENTT